LYIRQNLNYSEGYARYTLADQRRFFRIARASACEVQATIDVAYRLEAIRQSDRDIAFDLADHVAAMLTKFRQHE
jgi:four helix bundle protein